MEDHASFGYWLRRRRRALDLTQHDLAHLIGCAVSTIRKIEADERRPSRALAELLADRLGVPADERATFLQVARAERAVSHLAQPAVPEAAIPPPQLRASAPTGVTALRPAAPLAKAVNGAATPAPRAEPRGEGEPADAAPTLGRRQRRNRQKMLEKVYGWWIKGVLEQSLHREALIELNLAYAPEAVAHPWGMVVQEPGAPDRRLPPGTRVVEVFDSSGEELLILGEPGAGKTTLLLELARDLIARARQDESAPIPVIFHLSSWSKRYPSLSDWLVEELSAKYQVPRAIGRTWCRAGESAILPLLDGLDEVREDHREACVAALNAFRRQNGLDGIAICSRSSEYAALVGRLKLQCAVVVQPLTARQIDAYLADMGEGASQLRGLLSARPALQEMARTPLMLTIMALAYRDRAGAGLPDLDPQRQCAHLLDAYVQRMLLQRGDKRRYHPERTRRWLSWLARAMVRHDQTVLLIERMQPAWLDVPQQRRYAVGEGLGVALIAGVGTAVVYGLRSLLPDAILSGPAAATIGYEAFQTRLAALPLGGSPATAIWLLLLVLMGIGAGIAGGLTAGLIAPAAGEAEIAARDLWRRARRCIHIGLAAGLPAGAIAGLFGGLANGVFEMVSVGTIASIASTLVASPGRIRVVETLGWSWRRAARGLTAALLVALAWTLVMQVSGDWMTYRLVERVAVYTIALGLAGGITSGAIEARARPNQGVHRSLRNAATIGVMAALIVGAAGALLAPAALPAGLRVITGFEFGIAAGIVMGLGWGGFVGVQHASLRLSLWRAGAAPWRYSRFLDHAAECLLLRKVGGGYMFVHRLLMQHLADVDANAQERASTSADPHVG